MQPKFFPYFFGIFFCLGLFFFSLDVLAVESKDNIVIRGVLIEGVNAVGKSTVSQKLKEILTKNGIKLELNHIFFSRNPLVKFTWNKSQETENTPEEPYYFGIGTVLDLNLFFPKSDLFYIQDRNWLSLECWIKFFHPDKQFGPENFLLKNHHRLQWNVFLTASYETVMARNLQRDKKSSHADSILESEDKFIEYTNFCISKIPANENWIVIDTDDTTPDEVVEQILQFCNLNN